VLQSGGLNPLRLCLERQGLTGIESESRPRGEENAREGVQPCLCKLAYLATKCIDINSFQSPPIHRGRKNLHPKSGTTHSLLLAVVLLTTSSGSTHSSPAISFLSLVVYGSHCPLLHLSSIFPSAFSSLVSLSSPSSSHPMICHVFLRAATHADPW
jgi:hypothetical protein